MTTTAIPYTRSIAELVDLLERADAAYYDAADPIIEDALYDDLTREHLARTGVRWVRQGSVGDVQHVRMMGTLDKEREAANIPKFFDVTSSWVVLTPKIDGLGLELTFGADPLRSGIWLTQALTRGHRSNGKSFGERVTTAAAHITGVPGCLAAQDAPRVVRGEVFISLENFEKAQAMRAAEGEKPFKNPRNAAAGILRKGLPAYLTLLEFVAYVAFDPTVPHAEDRTWDDYARMLSDLRSAGFTVPPFEVIRACDITDAGLGAFMDKLSLPYATDGVVATLASTSAWRSLGMGSESPRYALAYKFEDESAETTITAVEWAATRTGRIVPTFVFEPVELEGTTVERATGHNYLNVVTLDVCVGDRVEVFKANMIIPQVRRAIERPFDPDCPRQYGVVVCPACDHQVAKNEVDLLCENPSCSAKLVNAITNACNKKNWDVDGIGEAVAEALVASGLVKSLPDLFQLGAHDLHDLVLGEKELGIKTAEKLAKNLQAAKQKPWAVTLHALGCPGLGEPECRAIAERYSLEDLVAKTAASELGVADSFVTELMAIKGMGKVTADVLVDWVGQNAPWLLEFAPLGFKTDVEAAPAPASDKLAGKTFVVTGTMSVPRPEVEALIEANGGKASGSISKKTDYLVAGEGGGGKREKAEALKVPVITEADLRAMLA